jgi:hypothetical protein
MLEARPGIWFSRIAVVNPVSDVDRAKKFDRECKVLSDPVTLTDRSEMKILVSDFSLFEPQTLRDEDAVQSVEEELHNQCEQGSGNCALQNRAVVIQIEAADNWFSQPADPDECGQRSGANVNDRAGFQGSRSFSRMEYFLPTRKILCGSRPLHFHFY